MGILPAIRDNAGSYLVALFVAPTSIAAANTVTVVQETLTAGPGASPSTANAAERVSIVGPYSLARKRYGRQRSVGILKSSNHAIIYIKLLERQALRPPAEGWP